MGNLLNSIKLLDLIESVNAWRETTVKTENLSFYYCCQRQVIKELCELFPNICISVFPQAFIIKTISIRKLDIRKIAAYT